MLLVSAPFVVGVGRGIALGPRMMLGILIGMSFNIIDNTVGQMGIVYGLNPLFVATLEFGILYIFMWSNATIFADKGFYIGDVFYFTEIGIQHYYLYNAKNVL
jgi:hypothetical protein